MNKLQAFAFATLTTLACSAALAAPGIDGNATVKGNTAGAVVSAGGKGNVTLGPVKAGEVDLTAGVNVNSIVVKGGKIKGNASVLENTAESVYTLGSPVNVNSIVVTK